jgi:hypothetical protein
MKKSLLLVCFLVSACSNFIWYKDGATQEDLAQAKYQCLKESQQREFYSSGRQDVKTNDGSSYYQSSSREVTNPKLFNACMNAKGFFQKKVEKEKK